MKSLISAIALAFTISTVAPAVAVAQQAPSGYTEIRDHRGYGHRRHYRPRHYNRHRHYNRPRYHNRHRHRDRSWVPFALGLGALGTMALIERQNYENHVAWCDRRYRSYDVATNTWVDFDGVVRVCRSPYR